MAGFAERWGFGPDKFWLYDGLPEELVEFDESLGLWHVYGYPEALEVLNNPDAFSTDSARLFNLDEQTAKYIDGDLTQMTGAQHAHLREQVATAFGATAMADLEPRVHEVAGGLLDNLAGRDRFDLLGEFVGDLSGIVFCELLGIPAEDRALFALIDQNMDAEAQLATVATSEGADYFDNLTAPLQPLRDMLGAHIDRRIRQPRKDLLSLLVGVRKLDGTPLSRDQIINFVIGMLGAGHLSTPLLIGNATLCLESFPDQAVRVRTDRSLVPGMLEETMRFLTPAAATYRATTVAAQIAGRTIPADQLVRVWFGAANRDPRRFGDPGRFDVTRDPNPHLGFGHGDHFCLGRRMIRIETRIVFNLLLDRCPDLRVDPDVAPAFFGSPDFTGVRSVWVRR
ncbi:MAG TPA: cytochrome P450 [Actinophytocola sp.]|uniref:cytochrome P450 n=1 Tax=Actinophytocola sp. TaxID=1872138 RepID=UPI002DB94548|nr:cytochrome P450 [Actinophytocola sp.]HEU5471979.1 cytochrome P450 [Actinophytocola sp.]